MADVTGGARKGASVSILYVTANVEPEAFEEKIRAKLLDAARGLPIISVSQKPINLGENICVGNVGAAYGNQYRQIRLAAKAAKTEWVCAAEADFLYPSEAYFGFEPPANAPDLLRYNEVWILWRSRAYSSGFRRKLNSEGAQWARRLPLIERLERCVAGLPEWQEPGTDWRVKVYGKREWAEFGDPSQPAVSVKSGWGMRPSTKVQKGRENDVQELPLWGAASKLREELFR